MSKLPRIRRLLAVGAVGAVAAGSAVALAGQSSAAPAAAPDRPFDALEQPATAADQPTQDVASVARTAGGDVEDARRATLPAGAPGVTVVPGADVVCLVVQDGADSAGSAYTCAPWAAAESGELSLTLTGGPEQAEGAAVVVGLVPDGTSGVTVRDPEGARTPVAVTDGFYVAHAESGGAVEVAAPAGTNVIDLADLPGKNE